MKYKRPSVEENFLNIAQETGRRSPCLRRKVGALIVLDGVQTSSGYNGPARGAPNCLDYGCLKDAKSIEKGKGYDHCRAGPLHAEINTFLNAARHHGGTVGATMYISATDVNGNVVDAYPCKPCQKAIINAGVKKVIVRTHKGIERFLVKDWVEQSHKETDRDLKDFY